MTVVTVTEKHWPCLGLEVGCHSEVYNLGRTCPLHLNLTVVNKRNYDSVSHSVGRSVSRSCSVCLSGLDSGSDLALLFLSLSLFALEIPAVVAAVAAAVVVRPSASLLVAPGGMHT